MAVLLIADHDGHALRDTTFKALTAATLPLLHLPR